MKKIANRLAMALLMLWLLPQSVLGLEYLVPGGQVIGLSLENQTVTVAAFDDTLGATAKAAGLQIGDRILSIDGQPIDSAAAVRNALRQAGGTVELELERAGKTVSLHLEPQATADGPRLGVCLRQGVTGIGTVTWYDPETGAFGSLGHGVNDSGGELLEMTRGSIYRASVQSVKRGESGEPGQLRGSVDAAQALGSLSRNTRRGIFGTAAVPWSGEAVPVAAASEVRTGPAVICSTVSGDSVREYSVEILKIYPNPKCEGRNLLVHVTDPQLLEATGGIVQGMSGSPILQDGKLIGAVTHVLVNDPTTGYGILIENMLDAAA